MPNWLCAQYMRLAHLRQAQNKKFKSLVAKRLKFFKRNEKNPAQGGIGEVKYYC